jgi:ATP-dependent RNA helicase DDX10/DBP4
MRIRVLLLIRLCLNSQSVCRFDEMNIGHRTLEALRLANLETATDIQAAAIPHALAGRDILGAAKTGSGKTLAFVIPVIECLYREKWSREDGLAAIIITPTRELALQIFEVLRVVGKKHQVSAGLITGGKKEFAEEQLRVVSMNVLVATPGRLLQHFEQTSGFDASQLMILVLDEADRILDMGFKAQLDAIIEYLPISRQTLLFSATQTKSVKDLARLSLKQPEYIAVHANAEEATPKLLVQNYIVCKLPEKLDVLFSFIKSHLKSKMIVFFSTCAQVRFVYECFCAMQPGIPISALHGKIKQERRTLIFMDFARRNSAVLLATDIAARGLDFPDVDWVLQVDAPEDEAMYIHRVGRTARYTSGGRALLLLMPSEEAMVLKKLGDSSVPIKKLTVNPNRAFSVAAKAAALLAAQPEFRVLAKKAFTSYLRSLQMLPSVRRASGNNTGGAAGASSVYEVLNLNQTALDQFAVSLGLGLTPPMPVLDHTSGADARDENRKEKNVNR